MATKLPLTLNTLVVATPNQVSSEVGSDTVILDFQQGVYHGLDEVGTFIWKQVQSPVKVVDVRDRILEEYEVNAEKCEQDLLALLTRLLEQGLIEIPSAQ